jgi:hypothetical protein
LLRAWCNWGTEEPTDDSGCYNALDEHRQGAVTREELAVERRPVSGEAQASGTVGQGQEIRVPLPEETASVDKGMHGSDRSLFHAARS